MALLRKQRLFLFDGHGLPVTSLRLSARRQLLPQRPPVSPISYGYWQMHFGGGYFSATVGKRFPENYHRPVFAGILLPADISPVLPDAPGDTRLPHGLLPVCIDC